MTFIRDDININVQEAQVGIEVGIDTVDISVVANTVPPTTIPDAFTTRADYIDDTLMYRGDATPGTLESSASWQMKKLVTELNGDITITYVNGDGDYIYVWDNRLIYTYS